ncbi:MAG TPA: MoaD/ThiS family protein, partial [Thermoanaerobaculia bacterium]
PFSLTVRLAEPFRAGVGEQLTIDTPVRSIGELISVLEERIPHFSSQNNELFNFAVNGELILHDEKSVLLENGDEVELLVAFSGG